MRGARSQKHHAQHLFRPRLADASRYCDDACLGPFPRLLRQRIQRLQRIGHAEQRPGAGRSRLKLLRHDGGGSTLIDGCANETMSIHAFALDRKKEIARVQGAAVDGNAVHRNGRGNR
jgi:hypothetical protein